MTTFHKHPPLIHYLPWLVAAFLLLWGLGDVPLTDVDEGAFAEASREMLARGDFISPWLLDAPRFDKPALIHWLQMTAMHFFGINAFAARLPSALAGLLWCWVLVKWTRDIARVVGVKSSAQDFVLMIAVTSIALPVISRVSTADAVLNALLAMTLYWLWRACMTEQPPKRHLFTRIAAVFIGLGMLTKGPIAILVPAGASLLALCMRPKSFKQWLNVVFDPTAWLLVILIAAPWYYLQFEAQGMPFITGFFGKHNLGRYTGTMLGFSGGLWYYPAWLLVSILPWIPMLFRTIVRVSSGVHAYLRHPSLAFVWAIPIFVLVFFSFSSTKLPHYGFYGLSGLFVLMALVTATVNQPMRAQSTLLVDRIFVSVLLLIFSLTFVWFPSLANLTNDSYYHGVLVQAGIDLGEQKGWMLMVVALGILGLFSPGLSYAWRQCVGAVAFAICLHLIFVPTVISTLRTPIVHAAQQVATINTAVVSWRLGSPSLSFNAKRVIPSRYPVMGDTVVLYQKRHQALVDLLASTLPEANVKSIWQEGGVEIVQIQ